MKGEVSHTLSVNLILEIGPHSTLQEPIRDCMKEFSNGAAVNYGSILTRCTSASETVLGAVGELYCRGYNIDISRVNEENSLRQRCLVPLTNLPEYPFDASRTYWPNTLSDISYRFRAKSRKNLLGTRVLEWNHLDARWHNIIKLSELDWLNEHNVLKIAVL